MQTKDFSKLSGVEKAAILLVCLGEEATSRVFKELSENEVRMISRAMMSIDHVPADLAKEVLNHFQKAKSEYAGLFVDGSQFVKQAISSTKDERSAEELMDEVASGFESRPLETIAMMEPRMVASLLENEHPQTVALVLSTQKPAHTSKILTYLPEELKSEVIYRVARIEKVSPDVLSQIEDALKREIGVVVTGDQQQVGGLDMVVEILTRMEKGDDRTILERIEKLDKEMAEDIRNKMFTFEDLLNIDDRGIQMILREVKNETLTLALKTASESLRDKLFSNISERAADIIMEDLEAMGPVRLSHVESAQQSIVKIALRLEEEGHLVIPGRGGQEVLV